MSKVEDKVTSLVALRHGASGNYIVWKKNIVAKCTILYGRLAECINTGKYPVYDDPRCDEGKLANDPYGVAKTAYLEEVKAVHRRRANDEDNKPKLYGTVLESISKNSRDVLARHRQEYEHATKHFDPIGLLGLIERTHQLASDTQLVPFRALEARNQYHGCVQQETENINDYYERKRACEEVYREMGNPPLADEDVAMDYLHGLSNTRFAAFKANLINQLQCMACERPPNIEAMHLLASSHITAHTVTSAKGVSSVYATRTADLPAQDKKQRGSRAKKSDDKRAPTSSTEEEIESSGSRRERKKFKGTCWTCGRVGHRADDCTSEPIESDDSASDPRVLTLKRCYKYSKKGKGGVRKGKVLLDGGAEVSLVARELLHNIRPAEPPLQVQGLSGEPTPLLETGTLLGIGDVYVLPDELETSILCEADMKDNFDYDECKQDGSATFQIETGPLHFRREGKLRVADMSDWIRSKENGTDLKLPTSVLVTTVEQNEAKYTQSEVRRAKEAREFVTAAGYISADRAIRDVHDGNIINIPLTGDDIKRAFDIYGPIAESVRGESVSRQMKFTPVDKTLILARTAQHMFCDVMAVMGQKFMFSIVMPMNLVITSKAHSEKAKELGACVQDAISILQAHRFSVTHVTVDPHASMKCLVGKFPGCKVEVAGPEDHLPPCDTRMRRAKDTLRKIYGSVPWEVPRSFIAGMVSYYAARRNCSSQGRNDHIAPKVELTGRKIDYRHYKLQWGDYVEIHAGRTDGGYNSMRPRTIPCIAMFPTDSPTGAWEFISMLTWEPVRKSWWTKMVTTPLVTEMINTRARAERGSSPRAELFLTHEVPVHEPTIDYGELTHIVPDTIAEPRYPPPINDTSEQIVTTSQAPLADGVNDERHDVHAASGISEVAPASVINEVVPATVMESIDENEEPPLAADDDDDEDDVPPLIVDDDDDDDHEAGAQAPPIRRSERLARARLVAGERRDPIRRVYVNMSVKAAVKARGKEAWDAAMLELKSMLKTQKAMHPVHRKGLSATQLKKVIRSSMFLKEKFNAMGAFEKLKARWVADGSQQDREVYPNTAAPTLALSSLMMLLQIAASRNQHAAVIDVTAAYLEAEMTGEEVFMEADPLITKLILKMDPNLKPFVDEKGKMVFKLDKAVYGCVQSALLWYEKLSSVLEEMGFSKNATDPCVFNRGEGNDKLSLGVFVDDMIALCSNTQELDRLVRELKGKFGNVTVKMDDDFSYLGMHVRLRDGKIVLTMEGYIEELLNEYGVRSGCASPSTGDIFKVDAKSPLLGKIEKERFHRTVAKLLYLCMRVKPEMLVCVIFLCTRVSRSTEEDDRKLKRVLGYLYSVKDDGIELSGGDITQLKGMIDASFAVHEGGKSHSGMAVLLGNGVIMLRSGKQKLVTRNSTEAELVALSDYMNYVLKCQEFMINQGVEMKVPILCQDNKSTISLVTKGGGQWRNKYMLVRVESVRQSVAAGEVRVEYTPTEEMIADVLTKPLAGRLLRVMRHKLGCRPPCSRGALE